MQESESEAIPTMDMDIFILCLWFHSTKHYRTLMPQYIYFEQNPVFSTSAGSLEWSGKMWRAARPEKQMIVVDP